MKPLDNRERERLKEELMAVGLTCGAMGLALLFGVAVQNIEGQEKQPGKKSSYPLKLECQITANP